ncbi:MAG: 50S ribosomal protein L6, partial [Planctomycetes bacterium]|nr:50S ribosomal protein L6 [Planctomycetota bacterium]
MSRIGKQPIQVPKGVTVAVADGVVTVKGKKGESSLTLRPEVAVTLEGETVEVKATDEERWSRAMQGTTRALIANMVVGVAEGYEKKLEINGVGYEAELQGKTLVLKVGFNKPRRFEIPPTVTVEVPSPTNIRISGIDKQ